MLQDKELVYNLNEYIQLSRPRLEYFQLDLKQLSYFYLKLFLLDINDFLDELLELSIFEQKLEYHSKQFVKLQQVVIKKYQPPYKYFDHI
jgi:hypothetical protein